MTPPSVRRRGLIALLGTGSLAALPRAGRAQAWPSRPIRLIVGFAPGGGTDIVARTMAPRLGELLGTQVVVENRAGASGMIGADAVAKSAPDGYTLLMGHANSNVIAPNVMSRVPYDPATDFSPIHYIGHVPNVLAIHPSVGARSVEELVALARSKPGVLTYASSGVGSSQHLAGALFTRITGTQITHIPYKGSGQAVGDLLAGQVSMNFDTLPPVLPHIVGGRLRALAISTATRLAQLPEVPTFQEAGIRGFDVTNWYSVMGPKGLPRELVLRIADATRRSLDDPAVRGKLEPQGLIYTGPRNPEEFATFIRAELAKYATMVKDLGVRAE
ncbi:MAG: tripartite tricarboxylate transporter substrate binding protein [Burkholderiales bacterium]